MEAETKTNPENAVDDLSSQKNSSTNVRLKLLISQIDPEESIPELEEKKKALEIELRQIEEQKQQESKEGKCHTFNLLVN